MGPYAPDQALRSVSVDGQFMGDYAAYAEERTPSQVFWGMGGMTYTTHTVVVTHADAGDSIFALDSMM